MTRFHRRLYDRLEPDCPGRCAIPAPSDTSGPANACTEQAAAVPSDRAGFDRLERAILELLHRYEELRCETSRLTEALAARERRVEELESRFREGNQVQRDVAKRIDDLLGQIDQIEQHFAERGA